MQAYSDPAREHDPHALPDIEIFEAHALDCDECECFQVYPQATGTGYADCPECGEIGITNNLAHFYWACFPGCLPDSDPIGPFNSEAEALAAAREGVES